LISSSPANPNDLRTPVQVFEFHTADDGNDRGSNPIAAGWTPRSAG
jgi:hypothetical protein